MKNRISSHLKHMFDHAIITKADGLLFLSVLAAIALFWLYLEASGTHGTGAVVFQDGQQKAFFSLSQDRSVWLRAADGGLNLLVVEDGSVRISQADCPDQLCVRQGWIQKEKETILCLPHRLEVRITGGEPSGLDAVAW